MPQYSIPASVYRGGTSRGIYFQDKDLPADPEERKRVILHGIDAWNLSQVDGLGAGTSHTSKCVVISPSDRPGIHVNYQFIQVGIGKQIADAKGTCGNLMSGAAAFAIDEGLVPVEPGMDKVTVMLYDTNAAKDLAITVPLVDGKARTQGEYPMPGVVRSGALIRVEIVNPGGGKTGKTLPLGPLVELKTPRGAFTVTVTDMINMFVFVDAADLGLTGAEPFSQLSVDAELVETLNSIRDAAAVALNWAKTPEEARESTPSVPKIAIVAKPQNYIGSTVGEISADSVDIVTRAVSMGRLHRTFPASGLYCLAGTCLLAGTVPYRVCRPSENPAAERTIRIGHPDGVADVRVTPSADDIASVGMDRNARRIMRGEVFVPKGA